MVREYLVQTLAVVTHTYTHEHALQMWKQKARGEKGEAQSQTVIGWHGWLQPRFPAPAQTSGGGCHLP